jgi:hypothetical protein
MEATSLSNNELELQPAVTQYVAAGFDFVFRFVPIVTQSCFGVWRADYRKCVVSKISSSGFFGLWGRLSLATLQPRQFWIEPLINI